MFNQLLFHLLYLRDDTLENLKATANQLNVLKSKNNWFHEYLVKHYQRKQVTKLNKLKGLFFCLLNVNYLFR